MGGRRPPARLSERVWEAQAADPGGGTLTVRRPRVRGLDARVQSRVLPLFARRPRGVSALRPELCLHGLAAGAST
jgi:hypothetical protein